MVLRHVSIPALSAGLNSMSLTTGSTIASDSGTTAQKPADTPTISIYGAPSQSGVLVKVQPPVCPADKDLRHVPCDIVLVIDVSGSMAAAAPIMSSDDQGKTIREDAGLSVLDITKHAARTILESLDEHDRLAIVTFSNNGQVLQELKPMNPANKQAAEESIAGMNPQDTTNLWDGIAEGLSLFNNEEKSSGQVPALLVLTDGQPTRDPLGGYVSAIKDRGPLPATIHTFGFGNSIQSGLLKTIAELGGGSYSYIPDSGMVGTVFVNAVAHLQSTFATDCSLKLTYPGSLGLTTATLEQPVENLPGKSASATASRADEVASQIKLGSLQYGQSRDIYLSCAVPFSMLTSEAVFIQAELEYSNIYYGPMTAQAKQNIRLPNAIPEAVFAYHHSRAMVCEYLASLFPVKSNGEYKLPLISDSVQAKAGAELEQLLTRIPARNFDDEYNTALMEDVTGQIKLAVSLRQYLSKWGLHYFLSLWDAHSKQIQNTFKDPGVQVYDRDSPLFCQCQKVLTTAFNSLKAPEPSRRKAAPLLRSTGIHSSVPGAPAPVPAPIRTPTAVSMASYNRSDYPCFSGSSLVTLADGTRVPVSELRRGMAVETPAGSRRVVAVLKTRVRKVLLCQVRNLLVTPWHPIACPNDGSDRAAKGGLVSAPLSWTFPHQVADRAVRYSGAIYSVLLEAGGAGASAHAVRVGGVWGVTLGHGIVGGGDARAHEFLGDYSRVAKALAAVGVGADGVAVARGVRRDARSHRMDGFRGTRGGRGTRVSGK